MADIDDFDIDKSIAAAWAEFQAGRGDRPFGNAVQKRAYCNSSTRVRLRVFLALVRV